MPRALWWSYGVGRLLMSEVPLYRPNTIQPLEASTPHATSGAHVPRLKPGNGLFISSQTRPLHANKGNQMTLKGTSP